MSLHHLTGVKRLTYWFWIWPQIYNSETDDDDEATINDEDLMEQVAGICNQLPRVQYLLMDDEDYGRPVQPQKNIMDIMSRCFKEANDLNQHIQ